MFVSWLTPAPHAAPLADALDGCAAEFDEGASIRARARASLRASPMMRYLPTVTALPGEHAGYLVTPPTPHADEKHRVLTSLEHSGARQVIEEWNTPGAPLYFYDAGLIHLEADAMMVNGYVMSQMVAPRPPRLTLAHAPDRRNDLQNYHRFRDALAADDVRPDNSYVETLGVLTRPLAWSADAAAITAATRVSAQLHFGRFADFVAPSIPTLLDHLGHAPALLDPLPLWRSGANAAWRAGFDEQFAGEHVCEMTFPRGTLDALPAAARRRLMFEPLGRAERRGCSVLIVAASALNTRLLTSSYNFRRWQHDPNAAAPPEWLSYIYLDSDEYVEVQGRLTDALAAGVL